MNTPAPSLTVRRLLVDLDTPLPRHWCGDAFRTAFFNALSMSFPAGEQLFIESMHKGMAALPEARRAAFDAEVQGFIGQEATHRRVHQRFNEHLLRQGLVNTWEARILSRRPLLESLDVRNWLAVTAATEHLTAVFAEFMLSHPQALQGAEARLRNMWLWHSAEESEHRTGNINKHLIEWHKKFTLSFACLVLFFVGAPLGAIIRKGGIGMPMVVSVIFFLFFHVMNIMGEKFSKRSEPIFRFTTGSI